MSSLGLVGYNKSFLYTAVRAPGSPYDVKMLESIRLHQPILNGEIFMEKAMILEGSDNSTCDNCVFSKHL